MSNTGIPQAVTPELPTCGSCDHFGDYDRPVLGDWATKDDGKTWYRPTLCLNRSEGAICGYPRTGTRVRVYDQSPACRDYAPRTWTAPESCVNCDRRHGTTSTGAHLCGGWPYYQKEGDAPCENGRAKYGKQLALF